MKPRRNGAPPVTALVDQFYADAGKDGWQPLGYVQPDSALEVTRSQPATCGRAAERRLHRHTSSSQTTRCGASGTGTPRSAC